LTHHDDLVTLLQPGDGIGAKNTRLGAKQTIGSEYIVKDVLADVSLFSITYERMDYTGNEFGYLHRPIGHGKLDKQEISNKNG
jgi:hypothetical protein